MANGVGARVCAGGWLRKIAGAIAVVMTVMSSQQRGQAQAGDALPFSKGFLVTGDYVVGGVDLDPHSAANGFITGTISMNGVPANSEILAAYLYWEMISTS